MSMLSTCSTAVSGPCEYYILLASETRTLTQRELELLTPTVNPNRCLSHESNSSSYRFGVRNNVE